MWTISKSGSSIVMNNGAGNKKQLNNASIQLSGDAIEVFENGQPIFDGLTWDTVTTSPAHGQTTNSALFDYLVDPNNNLFFLGNASGVAVGFYDFAVHGGAIAVIPMTMLTPGIPPGAAVYRSFLQIVTPLNSAGASVVKAGITEDDDAVVISGAFNGASWASAGPKTGRNIETSTSILPAALTTVENSLIFTNSGAVLDAGKFYVQSFWVKSGS